MKKLISFLIAFSAFPTALNAESYWLILRYSPRTYGGFSAALEKVEMESMAQCELQGAKWKTGRIAVDISNFVGFECIEGK